MDSDNKELFGYLIDNKVLVDIKNHRLISLSSEKAIDEKKIVGLRATMMRLLIYVLSAEPERIISNDEIMFYVWDSYKLSSSNQRLWQVMQSLEKKLIQLGIDEEFIVRVKPSGYYIKHNIVTPLYYFTSSI
ncbi:winged helix-turn-helix domain-containing protein [Enterobacteriaceae bacterium H11S18]|uniref:winged helix-turn-helix domain-containing protein n=1 Tax=Dryocola clanedunensis TaxID=2925396 RepID=UPI0022F02DF1|nr:winged helix-turn-helix domain-containing protein [Dryocola clanedunensis]MCT4704955.1 winged helix-turn-helix domain-containing protein [Dryocola clanedunensis]MCT4712105.1 winged helix-turn-helix domain-containing protein [Dryocola clanedunensis]